MLYRVFPSPLFGQWKGILIPESAKFLLVESVTCGENFACGIRNPGLWNPENISRSSNPTTIGIRNPSSTDNAWNPMPGIQNPRRGIESPRLAWIPLPCGNSQVYKLNIPNRNSVSYYVEKINVFYCHVTIGICGSVILHLSHVIHFYRLGKVATPSLRAIRWFAIKHGVHGSGATSFCLTLAILVSFFCGYFICNKVATEVYLVRKNWNLVTDNVTSVLDSPCSWYVNEH